MKTSARTFVVVGGAILALLASGASEAARLAAKEKAPSANPNDPTVRLYSLLDSKYNGKLDNFYVLADSFSDPKSQGEQQHVISVEYNKDHAFGKLKIHVRTVSQLTPAQLKAYTPKQIFDFAEADTAKFTKTDPGPFGKAGDVCFQSNADGSVEGTVPITPELQTQYDNYVNQYLIPALEKKAGGS